MSQLNLHVCSEWAALHPSVPSTLLTHEAQGHEMKQGLHTKFQNPCARRTGHQSCWGIAGDEQ